MWKRAAAKFLTLDSRMAACDVEIRRQVYADRFASRQIGGDLQDRRSAETSVSDQHLLSERLMIGSNNDFR